MFVRQNTKQTEDRLQRAIEALEHKTKEQQRQEVENLNNKIKDLDTKLQSKLAEKARLAQLEADRRSLTQKVVQVAVPTANAATGSLNRQEWLLKLRQCESGGNYAINTGNGFYGAYQFMISTWNNIASKTGRQHLVGVRPDLASPADQDAMIIDNTNMTMGLVTQNPGCYAKMGLSNKPPM